MVLTLSEGSHQGSLFKEGDPGHHSQEYLFSWSEMGPKICFFKKHPLPSSGILRGFWDYTWGNCSGDSELGPGMRKNEAGLTSPAFSRWSLSETTALSPPDHSGAGLMDPSSPRKGEGNVSRRPKPGSAGQIQFFPYFLPLVCCLGQSIQWTPS